MNETLNLNHAYALLVGVGGEDIAATVTDATALYKILTDEKLAAYPKKNVYLFTEKQATRDKILRRLEMIAEKTKGKEDATVLIYYSGHGGRFEKTTSGKKKLEYYLLTHGFDLDNPKETMLNGDIFSEKVDQITAEKMVVLLDCCHAAGMKRKGRLTIKSVTKSTKKVTYSNVELLKKLKGGKGRVFLSSCADDEESVILPGSPNSLFTQVMLEALSGEASKDSDFVRVIDMIYHVLLTVPKMVAKYDHQQNPVINNVTNLNAAYLLCLNGKRAVVKKRMMASKAIGTSVIDKMNFINGYSHKIPVEGDYAALEPGDAEINRPVGG